MESGIEIRLPDDGSSVDVEAYDRDGNLVPTPYRLVIRPLFAQPASRSPVLYAQVLSDLQDPASEVFRGVMQILGSNGRLTIVDRQRSVQPRFAAGPQPTAPPPSKKAKAGSDPS